jgi:uncharacterized membrane protein YadS
MNLHQVVHAGASGFVDTAVSIVSAILLGTLLGRVLSVHPKAAFLITCGTAICGGSAIAAIAPITRASDEDMAVSLGTVFTLNAIALLVFPMIGFALHLTQPLFGLWARWLFMTPARSLEPRRIMARRRSPSAPP